MTQRYIFQTIFKRGVKRLVNNSQAGNNVMVVILLLNITALVKHVDLHNKFGGIFVRNITITSLPPENFIDCP